VAADDEPKDDEFKKGRIAPAGRRNGPGESPALLEDLEVLSPQKTLQAIHQLRVHQIELEMQNEELRRTEAELDEARERYFDLYDLAPVGYCTISAEGLVLETNLTAVNLLGLTRGALLQRPIARFICKEDQDFYYLHRKQVLESGDPHACDLRMVKKDGTEFWAHMAATRYSPATSDQETDSMPVTRVVLSDISSLKRAEEEGQT